MPLLDELLKSLTGAQTPWAQQQMAQMLGQGAPSMVVPDGAPNADTASFGLPVQAPQETRMTLGGPSPAPARTPSPSSSEPSFGTFLAGALRGAAQADNPISMLLGGIGGAMGAGADVENKRQSYELLIQGGFSPAEAALAIQNPALAQQVAARREKLSADADTNKNLDYLVAAGRMTKEQAEQLKRASPDLRRQAISAAFSTKAPDIKEIEGAYGQKTAVAWNPATNSFEPVKIGQGASVAPTMAPAATQAPQTQTPASEAPAGGSGMLAGLQQIAQQLPQTQQATGQTDVSVGQPQVAAALPSGYRTGPAVPKAPDGYIHKMAPDGSGYLYGANGQPVFEGKAEADARAKARGESGAAREDEKRVAQQFLGGINRFKQLALDFGDQALERSLGPYIGGVADPETAGGLWGTGLSVDSIMRMVGRGVSELQALEDGGAAPTEIRDRIETTAKNLAAVMKPLVRKPGEGVWTDKDQINLEKSLGDMTRSRSRAEYDRRINDIVENVKNVFMIAVPDSQGPTGRSSNAPQRAEDVNTIFETGIFGVGGPLGPAKVAPDSAAPPSKEQLIQELMKTARLR